MPKKQCPECKSEKVIPIHYGFIDDPDAIELIKNEEEHDHGNNLNL